MSVYVRVFRVEGGVGGVVALKAVVLKGVQDSCV